MPWVKTVTLLIIVMVVGLGGFYFKEIMAFDFMSEVFSKDC